MKTNATKIALLLIAAVMLVSIAFAGAASAKTVEVTDWNNQVNLQDPFQDEFGIYLKPSEPEELNDGDTIKIIGGPDYVIKPLRYDHHNNLSRFMQSLTLDFSEYKGTFAGTEGFTSSPSYIGSLFGKVTIAPEKTLEIKGLNLTSVSVNGGQFVGGIIGSAEDDSAVVISASGTLFFNDCHLLNCSIGGSTTVGGLLGRASGIVPIVVKNCTVSHCDVVANGNYVGGMGGYLYNSSTWEGCRVTNSTVASTGGDYVGGLLGKDETTATFTDCAVVDTSVYAGSTTLSQYVGGLVGGVTTIQGISGCKVTNCVIASQGVYVGGLSGNSGTVDGVDGCEVKNCTISSYFIFPFPGVKITHIGGLFGGPVSLSNGENNDVLNSAISGSVFGTNCAGIGRSSIGTDARDGVPATYYSSAGTSSAIESPASTFWKDVYWGGYDGVPYTVLGTYGTVGGYGVGSAPKLVYDAGGATGTVPSSRLYASGTTVTVPGQGDLQKAGCTFMGWYSERTGLLPAGSSFEITKDTTLSAKWALPAYVEVSTWSQLNKSVAEWNATGTESGLTRTVVVKNDILDRNSGEDVDGINVSGNVIITPDASSTDKKLSIDGKEHGRLFNITSTGNLTLIGNGTSTLELTKGKHQKAGGAVHGEGTGMLTLSVGADITNSTSVTETGGGVYLLSGTLTMNGGNITGCKSDDGGGGVDINKDAVFTMTSGSITKCSSNSNGGGVDLQNNVQFRVSGDATIVNNTHTDGTRNNVYLTNANILKLTGPLTGLIGISNPSGDGKLFGNASGTYQEVVNFFMDSDSSKRGTIGDPTAEGYEMKWSTAGEITFANVEHGHPKTNVSAGRTGDYVTIQAYADDGYIITDYTSQSTVTFSEPRISLDGKSTFQMGGTAPVEITPVIIENGTYIMQNDSDSIRIADLNGDGVVDYNDSYTDEDETPLFIPSGAEKIPDALMKSLTDGTYPKEVFILKANYWDGSTSEWVEGPELNDNTGKFLPDVSLTLSDGTEIVFTNSDGEWIFDSFNTYEETDPYYPLTRLHFLYILDFGEIVPAPVKPSPYTPSHRETGYTVILPENTTATPTPTAKPTVQPIENPTMKPTTQPTQKSPAPLAGLIAGLGAALVIARLRK